VRGAREGGRERGKQGQKSTETEVKRESKRQSETKREREEVTEPLLMSQDLRFQFHYFLIPRAAHRQNERRVHLIFFSLVPIDERGELRIKRSQTNDASPGATDCLDCLWYWS
jgi:hypothetical protein